MRYRVGELVDSISKKCDFKTDKIIFLNTSDIEDGKIVNNNCYKISDLPGQAKKKIKNGDILFSEIRPKNKRYALVENIDETNYVVSTKLMVLRNKDSKVLNMKYFYYFLTSPKMLRYLQSEAEARSGTFPQITFKDNIYPITINLPSLAEQNKIVKNIDSIVNKIKNNQKINTNLEEINKLYFSNIFKNTTNFIKASDIAEIKIGKTPPRKEKKWFSSEKGQIWVSIKDMNSSGSFILDSSEYLINNATNNFNIQKVSKNTVILSFKLTIGRVKITEQDMFTNEAIAQFKNAKLPFQFLYTYLKSFPYETLGSTSSIAKSINSKIVKNIPILHPEKYELDNYMSFAEPIFKEIELHQLENKKLLSIKDELLHRFFN